MLVETEFTEVVKMAFEVLLRVCVCTAVDTIEVSVVRRVDSLFTVETRVTDMTRVL